MYTDPNCEPELKPTPPPPPPPADEPPPTPYGELDSDGDGIKNSQDVCPNERGPRSNNGCPYSEPAPTPYGERDSDGDGIKNSQDVCPNKRETFNGYRDNDGCPDTRPTQSTESSTLPKEQPKSSEQTASLPDNIENTIIVAVIGIIIIVIIAKLLKKWTRREKIDDSLSSPDPDDPLAEVKKYWNELRVDQREEICSKIGINLKNAQKKFDKIRRKKDLLINEIGKRISKEKDRQLALRERAKLDAEKRAKVAEKKAKDETEYAKQRAKKAEDETEYAKQRAKKAEDDVRFWKEEAGKASSSKRDQNTPPYRGQSGEFLRIEDFFKKCEEENPDKSRENSVSFYEIIGIIEEKDQETTVNDPYNEGKFTFNCHAKLRDETGVINITIWEPDFEYIKNGSEVTIKEGYAGIWNEQYNIQCGGKFGGKISSVKIEQEKVKDILGSKKLDVLNYIVHSLYRPETENSSKKERYTDKNLDDLINDFIRAGYHKEKFEGQFENELWLLELIILTELLLRSKESSKFEQTQEQQQQQKEEERKYEEYEQDREKIHYDILGVSRDATQAEIKAAYRKLAKKWHPDKHQDDKNFQDEMMKKINEAYEILSDPVKRSRYDDSL